MDYFNGYFIFLSTGFAFVHRIIISWVDARFAGETPVAVRPSEGVEHRSGRIRPSPDPQDESLPRSAGAAKPEKSELKIVSTRWAALCARARRHSDEAERG